MSHVSCDITTSLDGFVAGPRQSLEHPIGEGGDRLHHWMFDPHGEDQAVIDAWHSRPGAYVMGRSMFGPGHGDWDLDWTGSWGDEPPYHAPVFVLSHHPRPDLPMIGGTTFHFVTDGIEHALDRAREAAQDRDVAIAGGAQTVNEYLAAGLIDELHLHVAPVVLGSGARLFGGIAGLELEPVEAIGSTDVTHLTYRVR